MAIRIADIPKGDRPRERLDRLGSSALSDAELVALVLRSGKPGENAVSVSSRLLSGYQALHRLADARLEDLATSPGIGPAKAASLLAAFELGRRVGLSEDLRTVVSGPQDLAHLARCRLNDPHQEQVVVVILDGGNRLIRVQLLTSGSSDTCLIPIRETLAAVLRNGGATFGVAHNHPSGQLRPSKQDVEATRLLRAGAEAAGLNFVDHIILGPTDWASMREAGFFN
ncbi:MAG: DNA repair protein RadC [Actinomycetota bacterium]|nr:DNA repair protein RadC [Actinomycetota bacterium]